MTREEFLSRYVHNSGLTADYLKSMGRVPAPCTCDWEGCEGWQMAHLWELEDEEKAGYDMLPQDRQALDWIRANP